MRKILFDATQNRWWPGLLLVVLLARFFYSRKIFLKA